MIDITLPDASVRTYDQPVTVVDVAKSIGSGLAKATLAGVWNGEVVDCRTQLNASGELRILTARDAEGLDVLRHSTAHLLAQAVKRHYPDVQVAIGPTIEDGFYYDFFFPQGFSEDDLEAFEATMHDLVKSGLSITRCEMPKAEAMAFFQQQGEAFKADIVDALPCERVTLYQQGEFTDLCRGPHVQHTGQLGAFKLMKLAGAYWRGDSNQPMLQRVYGTAWRTRSEVDAYVERLEEARRRDHRELGRKMDLFHTQEEATGMIFWHANGLHILEQLKAYIRHYYRMCGYDEIATPQVVDRRLWERSGHWDKFADHMYLATHANDTREQALKPMSCPCHVQVFNQGLRSYRTLPLRLAEFGVCHRYEPSGSLHGLMRLRCFTQDDAHIFCTPEHIASEVKALIQQTFAVYRTLGFDDVSMKLSTRPQVRVGEDSMWDRAEEALEAALELYGHVWDLQPGEGAFYGPKIEFTLRDCLGRSWQCGTIQLDFSMPDRLGAAYVDADGERQVPVMIHRAILGSMERFLGMLIENTAGHLPLWLHPTQAMVVGITSDQDAYVHDVVTRLQAQGMRARADVQNEKVGYKIRQYSLQRVPYVLVCGAREMEAGTVSVRTAAGDNLGAMTLDHFLSGLQLSFPNDSFDQEEPLSP